MIHKIIHYLFPQRQLHEKLPLRSLRWSSHHSRHGRIPDNLEASISRLMTHNIIRTRQDGYRLIKEYPGVGVDQIIRTEKRKRRHVPRIQLAWRRLKRLW